MHYADGTEVKVGDLCVGGQGGYDPAPVTGYVVRTVPGASSCNMALAVLRPFRGGHMAAPVCFLADENRFHATPQTEWHTTSNFYLLHRDGEPMRIPLAPAPVRVAEPVPVVEDLPAVASGSAA